MQRVFEVRKMCVCVSDRDLKSPKKVERPKAWRDQRLVCFSSFLAKYYYHYYYEHKRIRNEQVFLYVPSFRFYSTFIRALL